MPTYVFIFFRFSDFMGLINLSDLRMQEKMSCHTAKSPKAFLAVCDPHIFKQV